MNANKSKWYTVAVPLTRRSETGRCLILSIDFKNPGRGRGRAVGGERAHGLHLLENGRETIAFHAWENIIPLLPK